MSVRFALDGRVLRQSELVHLPTEGAVIDTGEGDVFVWPERLWRWAADAVEIPVQVWRWGET